MAEPNVRTEEEAATTIEASWIVGATERLPPDDPTPAPAALPAGIAAADSPNRLQPPGVWTNLVVPEDDSDSALGIDIASSTDSVRSSILNYRVINGRTYHHDYGNTSQYWSPNDERQNNTLDIAYHAYTLMLGGKLHLAPLPGDIKKVVDVGTGTGVWAIDFADAHPNTEVVGIDLSPIQPEWVPPNLYFQIDDFSLPWTFEENSVDFVHLRFLSGCVQGWTQLFKQAYRVLKPGGYIESLDFDATIHSDDGTVTDKTALSQWGPLFQEGARKLGSHVSFDPIMEGLQHQALVDAGFVNITEKRYKVPVSEWQDDPVMREVGQYIRVSIVNDVDGLISAMATQLGWTPEEITVFAAHIRREMCGLKIHAYYHGGNAYAQKPVTP